MAKKKNKAVIRPWCWYCEREFEDEKVLMQHQKAKHFKCKMCPRRLNTAGGLAVHIQQVHKLEPENLPRIENTLPGRDGYEVEIFGMEGIPAPDVADYKKRKEVELGLNPGTITQPQAKRPKIENRVIPEAELRAQLEAHKALMGATESAAVAPAPAPPDAAGGAVYNAAPQTYTAPAAPAAMSPPVPAVPGVPGSFPPVPPPFMPNGPPPGLAGAPPPFPPFPGMPPFAPQGFPPPGFPPGQIPPGIPPFPPGGLPPGITPPFLPPGATPPIPGHSAAPAPNFVPASSNSLSDSAPAAQPPKRPPIPNEKLTQTNPELKKGQVLKYTDANYSPEENRAYHAKYYYSPAANESQALSSFNTMPTQNNPDPTHVNLEELHLSEETRGKKRARAEDFL